MEDERELAIPIEERAKIFKGSIFLPLIQGLSLESASKKLLDIWSKKTHELISEGITHTLGIFDTTAIKDELLLLLEDIYINYPEVSERVGIKKAIDEIIYLQQKNENRDRKSELAKIKEILATMGISPFVLRFIPELYYSEFYIYLDTLKGRMISENFFSVVFSYVVSKFEEKENVPDDDSINKFLLLMNIFKAIPHHENGDTFFPFFLKETELKELGGLSEEQIEKERGYLERIENFYREKRSEWGDVYYLNDFDY